MGNRQEYFKKIREEYADKGRTAEREAEIRREELHTAIPALKELDARLSSFGLRVMEVSLQGGNVKDEIEKLKAENQKIQEEKAALLRKNGYPADYCQVRYECPACSDTGYVGIRMCDCLRRRLIAAGIESSGMAGLLKKQNFENFSIDFYRQTPEGFDLMKKNLQLLKDYAENFTPGSESLLFFGGTGLGKTHLSSAIANKLLEKGFDVFYNSAVGMISDFEFRRFGNGLASESDDTARYTECDLLIVDDLGTEVVNQFTLSCLYYVLNTRLNLQKPTLISTNLSSQELRKLYSDRITSRLMGEYLLVPFLGTDVRKLKLQ